MVPKTTFAAFAAVDHFSSVFQRKCKWLLTENVFPGTSRRNRLITMQFIGRADIDHVDLRITEKLAQVTKGPWYAILVSIHFSTLWVAAEERLHTAVGLCINGPDHSGLGYVARTDQSPPNLSFRLLHESKIGSKFWGVIARSCTIFRSILFCKHIFVFFFLFTGRKEKVANSRRRSRSIYCIDRFHSQNCPYRLKRWLEKMLFHLIRRSKAIVQIKYQGLIHFDIRSVRPREGSAGARQRPG